MCKPLFLNYVLSSYPLLWVETHEEFRAMTSFASELKSTKRTQNFQIFSWDCIDGIKAHQFKDGVLQSRPVQSGVDLDLSDSLTCLSWAQKNLPEDSVLFLKDYHPWVIREPNVRKIRNMISDLKATCRSLVIISHTVRIPPELEKEITVIPFDLPGADSLKIVLKSICEAASRDSQGNIVKEDVDKLYPKDTEEKVIRASQGMTSFEAENAFSVALTEKGCFDPAVIRREKAAVVKKTGLLEVMNTDVDLDQIGGLENLKEWLLARKVCFSDKAREFGIARRPRGALLLGVPGCGKSLMAKATSRILERPLLRLDVGTIFSAYQGESESRLRQVLRIAEAVAPCNLFIDELEKAFAGTKEGDSDGHGTTKRVFGTWLTWMQEHTEDVFIIATANDVTSLPAPLLRAQRFDVIFWVDLPGTKEREDILKIHLKKAKQDPAKFDLPKLAEACDTFSGAEIETWVQEAMVCAFARQAQALATQDLMSTIKEVTPISQISDIQGSRDWAKSHGVKYASKVEPPKLEGVKLRKIASVGLN